MNEADKKAFNEWVEEHLFLIDDMDNAQQIWLAACEWRDSQVVEPLDHAVIAGALFDFMGWLTSRDERIVLSARDLATPAVNALKRFSEMRGLSLNLARVQDWQNYTTPPAAQINQRLVEALEQAMWVIDGMEQNYGNLWQVDETPESIDLLLTKIRAAIAAAKNAK